MLNKRIAQRNKYLAIIAAFATNKNDILNYLEFTAELLFDQKRFTETMCELVDLRKIKIVGANAADSDIGFFVDAIIDLTADPTIEKAKAFATKNAENLLSKIIQNQRKGEGASININDIITALTKAADYDGHSALLLT